MEGAKKSRIANLIEKKTVYHLVLVFRQSICIFY